MVYFLALQHGVNNYELGLYCQDNKIKEISDDKIEVSRQLLTQISQLLDHQKLTIDDISFIAINQGPGPFTTLRALITTVNGINFANKIPIIGINGLVTFAQEHFQSMPLVALLNAYNNDVYYAIKQLDQPLHFGCENIELLLQNLAENIQSIGPITFIGQGAQLFSNLIYTYVGNKAILPDSMPLHSSLDSIASAAYDKWINNEFQSSQIVPLYLKDLRYKALIS